ncbi:potassium channel family protein [Actinomycetes bacterium KLBMP 9797]
MADPRPGPVRHGPHGVLVARGRVVAAIGVAVAAAGAVAALAVLDAERANPDANIRTYGDALWWAVTTITTVGYGDRFPTTTEGRLVAAVLMVSGIGLLGVVTASLASWFVERVGEVARAEQSTQAKLDALTAEVRALRLRLDERDDQG